MSEHPHEERPRLRELTVAGTPREIGYQHGQAFAAEIDRFLHDKLARINILRDSPISEAAALRLAGEYARWIEHEVPDTAEEIAGIANGANITYLEAVLLQIRRELIADNSASECTAVGRWTETSCWLAQTVDLAGDMSALACILRIIPSKPCSPTICMFTFMGLCGYLGINDAGLACGINMVHSPHWRPGVSPYLLVRHLLSKSSILEAIDEVQRIRRASSRCLLLADLRGMVALEMTVTHHQAFATHSLVHTNHFITPTLLNEERNTFYGLKNSIARFDRASQLLADGAPPEVILRDHADSTDCICSHDGGNIRVPHTVGAVILQPRDRMLYATSGSPCRSSFDAFPIRYCSPTGS